MMVGQIKTRLICETKYYVVLYYCFKRLSIVFQGKIKKHYSAKFKGLKKMK